MFYFSKSKYCLLWQCPKLLWLNKYRPELKPEDPSLQARFDAGNEVGDLAMGLFGDFTEVTAKGEDGKLDLNKMKALTDECIKNGVENICEASFDYYGLYCAVDILHKENDGYAIYEVKSSTDAKHIYAVDIAYQKYALENCGVNVTGTYLVCVDSDYVRNGELDIKKLFKVIDMSKQVNEEYKNVPILLKKAEETYSLKSEPETDIGLQCADPYSCAFWGYCTKNLPKPSVFDLYKMSFEKKMKFYKDGKVDFETLFYDGSITNGKQLRQMLYEISEQEDYIDKGAIRDFLSKLSFPLYFLDFETVQDVIPQYDGIKPYQQIPFQYSLHYIETPDGELKHKEFLAESGIDPRRAIAERLCEDIPMNVCVTAYNKTFERGRLQELAEYFPDLAEHLINIKNNIIDLLVPFQSIHNGGEAMTVFPQIRYMSPNDAEQTRHNLLKYCELDTFAMVKVWQKLKEAVE